MAKKVWYNNVTDRLSFEFHDDVFAPVGHIECWSSKGGKPAEGDKLLIEVVKTGDKYRTTTGHDMLFCNAAGPQGADRLVGTWHIVPENAAVFKDVLDAAEANGLNQPSRSLAHFDLEAHQLEQHEQMHAQVFEEIKPGAADYDGQVARTLSEQEIDKLWAEYAMSRLLWEWKDGLPVVIAVDIHSRDIIDVEDDGDEDLMYILLDRNVYIPIPSDTPMTVVYTGLNAWSSASVNFKFRGISCVVEDPSVLVMYYATAKYICSVDDRRVATDPLIEQGILSSKHMVAAAHDLAVPNASTVNKEFDISARNLALLKSSAWELTQMYPATVPMLNVAAPTVSVPNDDKVGKALRKAVKHMSKTTTELTLSIDDKDSVATVTIKRRPKK